MLLLAVTATQTVSAAWRLSTSGQAELRTGYNSNLRLNEIDELDTPQSFAAGEFMLMGRDERTALQLSMNAAQADYSNLDVDIRSDYGFTVNFDHGFETWGINLQATQQRVNTLANALDDSGLLDATVQRDLTALTSGVQWQLSPRLSVGARSSYQDVGYRNSRSLSDFRFVASSFETVWQGDEKTRWLITVEQSEFETLSNSTESSTLAGTLGIERALSETLDISLTIGKNRTDTTSLAFFGPFVFLGETSSDDLQYAAKIRKRWPRSDLTIDAGQQVQPVGNGILTNRQFVSLSWRHRFSEFVSFGVSALLREFDEVNSFGTRENDRIAARYSVSLSIDWSERWASRVTATHRTQAFDLRDDVARGNGVLVSLIYQFDRGER